jgi:hypothetical protein
MIMTVKTVFFPGIQLLFGAGFAHAVEFQRMAQNLEVFVLCDFILKAFQAIVQFDVGDLFATDANQVMVVFPGQFIIDLAAFQLEFIQKFALDKVSQLPVNRAAVDADAVFSKPLAEFFFLDGFGGLGDGFQDPDARLGKAPVLGFDLAQNIINFLHVNYN